MCLEKEVCKTYKVSPKKISNKTLFNILEILVKQFYDVRFIDCEACNCSYSIAGIIGEETKNFDDEKGPDNYGCGWDLRETVLSAILCDRVLKDSFCYDDIRWQLMSNFEKVKSVTLNY